MAKADYRPVTRKGAVILTCVLAVVMAVCVALSIVAPVLMLNNYDAVLRQYFGEGAEKVVGQGYEGVTEGFDTAYNKSGYDTEAAVQAAARSYFREGAAEGYVLLENDEKGGLPIETSAADKTRLDLYSQSSVDFIIGGTGSGTSAAAWTLKDAFEEDGYTVNSALWNYYSNSGVSRGAGAMLFGNAETWEINEVPLATLKAKVSGFESFPGQGGVAVFVMSRTGGEGRDEARSMAGYTNSYNVDAKADMEKSYLEPNSTELEILDYLNTAYDRVILVLNTNNIMETGWISDYGNIKSVIWVPGGGDQAVYALADIFCGKAAPSGRLADTMAYDNFSSPAMVNFGDIAYTDASGKQTGYYGLSYDEGIYVGYKYYETRYYDSIADGQGTGAAGTAGSSTGSAWNYADEVAYTFGYGKSFTTFEWSDFTVTPGNQSGNVTADDTLEVSVTVTNTGSHAGKDVVEIYASVPYTEFDKTNHIEKPAVSLVGYAKTGTLAAADADGKNGGSETVKVAVKVSDLTSYDDVVNKTYILESGNYFITAATDAHEAVNNVLAADGSLNLTDAQKAAMTSAGDAGLVYAYSPKLAASASGGIDAATFSASVMTGVEVTNQFGDTTDSRGNLIANADEGGTNLTPRDKYLTRQDWNGTWPDSHANQDSKTKSGYSELNGYTWERKISSAVLANLKKIGTAEAANNPQNNENQYAKKESEITSELAGSFGQDGQDYIVKYRGLDYADIGLEDWFKTLSLIPKSDVQMLLGAAGYSSADIDAIAKPRILDRDGPAGLNEMTTGSFLSIAYPAEVCIAATWNTDVAAKHGFFTGNDALQNGISAWYGPAMDIHRTPFSGRNFEYYSEDSFLSGSMASATVSQAASLGLSTYVKHFVMNDQENHRCDNGLATWANEQAIREQYLKVFQMVNEGEKITVNYYAMDEDGNYIKNKDGKYEFATREMSPMRAVMSSFNRIGSTWAGGDYRLITRILRMEWGFSGAVLTDFAQDAGWGYQSFPQEIRAGATNMLLNYGTGAFVTFDSPSDIYFEKVALSNFMYTVVNSNGMNGYLVGVPNPGLPFAYYYWILAALEVIAVAGFVVSAVFIGLKWYRLKKQDQAE